MSTAQILGLGTIAGSTILFGLPMGRLQTTDVRIRAALSATATGILLFLLWDVLSHGVGPVETALTHAQHGAGWGRFAGLAVVFGGALAVGLMGLVYYDRWIGRQQQKSMLGPGAASAAEFEQQAGPRMTPARWLAVLIATGIGIHNFGEGLAIGQSAAAGEVSLALVLIIGFGLHNATEGFGIVAPLAGDTERPSWRFLGLLGLIGGAPTFLGTLVGQAWTSQALSVAFFGLAAGSILYVVIQLFGVNARFAGCKTICMWATLGGVLLGFATDWVLVAAGA